MRLSSFSKIIIIAIGIIFLLGLGGCQNTEEITTYPTSTPSLFIRETNMGNNTITATETSISKITMTRSSTSTSNNLPQKGEYIIYESGKYLYYLSIDGREMGVLMVGAIEGRNWLSPNQEIVALSNTVHAINFYNIYTGETSVFTEQENCRFGVSDFSWSPEGNKFILACRNNSDQDVLQIFTYPEGEHLWQINKRINNNSEGTNYPYGQKWSPDGKWIAYFINTGDQLIGDQGPFITDTTCIAEKTNCEIKTTLYMNNHWALIEWTEESKLAMLDKSNYLVDIYSMPTFTLQQSISLPEDYWGITSFAWSQNSEWFAVGAMGGIYLMSSITGEIKEIREKVGRVLFWLEIK